MTFTKEQLIERARENVKSLKFASTQHAFEKAFPAIEIDIRLAEIALASLEAEAVGEVIEQQSGMMLDGLVISEKPTYRNIKGIHNMKMMPLGTQFYTAPPAPVSMKDHQIRELVNELRDIAVEYHGTQQLRERIARTVRAAMLQGAAGNSPVIPDGWVAVPVDMAPEQMRAVQINSELGSYAAANLSGAYSLFREFWDVAVAAAPQQEEE